jgi:glycerol-3-phosphate acyltransferase PlsY
MEYLLSAIIGYLLGSIPTAYLIVKKSKGVDITNTGSGNVGAMNSFEVSGSKSVGLLVLIIDALKGLSGVYICLLLFPISFVYPATALFFAVFSHCFNPWIGFKGGRGLATAAGGAALLFPYALLVWGILWVITFVVQRDILWANIWATPVSLIIVYLSPTIAVKYSFPKADTSGELMLFSMALFIIIFVKHIDPLKEIIKKRNLLRKVKDDDIR